MAPRRVKVPGPDGKLVDGYDTAVAESSERFSEYKLEDGTILRGKVIVLGAIRVIDQWDNEGNPVYIIKAQQVFVVSEAQDDLRKKVQ